MKRHYFDLSPDERFDLLSDASRALNKPGAVLEKDIWVCWALEALFTDPQQRMVFKGGTSLRRSPAKMSKPTRTGTRDTGTTWPCLPSMKLVLEP